LSVEPVRLFTHCQRAVQGDAPWGLERISQRRQVQPNPPYKYTYPTDAQGQDTFAYIIDTGIKPDHIEFGGRVSPGRKFVTSTPPASDADVVGHGTHVAGTIGGENYGVAKKVQLVPVKVFSDITGSARTDDIIVALEWVRSQARGQKAAVNMSLGGSYSPALNAAVAATVRSGVVVCVAAGNEMASTSRCHLLAFVTNRPLLGKDLTDRKSPASEPLAITVAAMDKTDEISDFSNYGRFVDVFGPGTDITSSWIGSNNASKTISGTSMGKRALDYQVYFTHKLAPATPHITGLACCILSDNAVAAQTPYEVASEIGIRADKNKLNGLDGITSNTIAQVF
jgi:subtilisin family serine protease